MTVDPSLQPRRNTPPRLPDPIKGVDDPRTQAAQDADRASARLLVPGPGASRSAGKMAAPTRRARVLRRTRTAGLVTTLMMALTACGTTVPNGAYNGASGTNAASGPGSLGQPGGGTPAAPGGGLTGGPPTAGVGTTGTVVTGTGPGTTGGSLGDGTSGEGTQGASRVTTPLTIGVLAAGDTQQGAKTAGVDSGTSISAEDTLHALMRQFKGGIAGRPVRFVYKAVPTTTSNYETELSADCALFTQDNHADIVISDIGYYNDNLTACLNHAHVSQIEGGWGLADNATFARYPGYFTPGFPSYDLRFGTLVAAGVRSGALKRGMKVGVVVESCPFIQAAYKAQFLPRAQAAGLVVDEATVQCTSGFQDAGAIGQQNQAAAFRFQTNQDQTVMFATYPTSVDLLFFSQYASTQQYHPAYWLDSLAEPQIAKDAGDYPADQVKKMSGVGWIAAMETTSPTYTRPEQKRCLAVMRSQSVTLTRPADYVIAFTACDAFFLLETALNRSGGHSSLPALRTAIEGLGSSFSASVMTGRTFLSPGRHYGTSEFSLFGYQAACDCFRYSGAPRAWV